MHGDSLKERSSEVMASLRDLQKSVLQKQRDIGIMYDTIEHNLVMINMHTIVGVCTIHMVALQCLYIILNCGYLNNSIRQCV